MIFITCRKNSFQAGCINRIRKSSFNLHGNAKSRYEEKLVAIDLSIYPFSTFSTFFSKDFTKWPDISYADNFAYLINFPSIYTKKSFCERFCEVILKRFCERFIPSVAEIRTALFNFYHEKYEQLLYHELIDVCVKEYMKINISTNVFC